MRVSGSVSVPSSRTSYDRKMRSALLMIAFAGCNPLYGIEETGVIPDADLRRDRDRDMIADVLDPCIANGADYGDFTALISRRYCERPTRLKPRRG